MIELEIYQKSKEELEGLLDSNISSESRIVIKNILKNSSPKVQNKEAGDLEILLKNPEKLSSEKLIEIRRSGKANIKERWIIREELSLRKQFNK